MGETVNCDVLILGGGPAGLSALFWGIEYGMDPLLIEKSDDLGGQLLRTYNPIANYMGIGPISGKKLKEKFVSQIRSLSDRVFQNVELKSIDLHKKTFFSEDGRVFRGQAVILATGVRRRTLGIPNEDAFRGRGVLESGVKVGDEVKGKTVFIVGGGDAAIENALILSKTAEKVIVSHRRDEFTARKEFMKEARGRENLILLTGTVLRSIVGRDSVEAVDIKNAQGTNRIETEFVLIRIGNVPNSELFSGQIEMDADGYVVDDAATATSVAGVFAVGDLVRPAAPTISTAIGHGALAARGALQYITN
jgi:thioredoxin reductase (NADPH)